ncbi:aspartate aminotransferase family protein [Bacillus thuringiensis]|uniref:aspartate aminotransferase family protein n=1 Tax=Bacillus thuringiensis TaxID=1428 RepID=UPI000BEDEE6F|nr:aminotransferase class III-fold pyridoxal phosphate-dependent enzyme [Bacillus thuringiensis]PDY27966.1 aspartate aminotransferase family protein [Bacillus thuringiensis]PFL06468.1 aspartate aminotransferase family protein [Bacillus thuringiensis]PGH94439.1 aspartate aminotransferase family protein [Bacillus thuringiensis]PGU41850.1 aspartate aminotransferase family protein [Bacillus thuringiensis]
MEVSLLNNFEHLSPVWPHFTQIHVDYAKGPYIYDINGKEFLDFTSGIGVTNTGHCHPRIVNAIKHQAEKMLHAQATILYNTPITKLSHKLCDLLPSELNCFFFSNSGSEAVESAIKLARHATKKTNIICFQGGYHGRTVGAMAVTTAKSIYRKFYQPLMPGVIVSPFPYEIGNNFDSDELTKRCLKELEHILLTQTSPEETAAMIIEPILGEGGYVIPPKSFIQGLREICDKYEILLIFDEIQTGFGRTGKLFAMEHFEVTPDILVIAKGLASGLPLSGIAASQELMSRWITGSHGGTYGGNILAAAAAIETINVLKEEELVENSKKTGEILLNYLKGLQEMYPFISDVRGLGLMIACEFLDHEGLPDSKTAKRIRELCVERGLILLTCGTQDHVIRWIPPLIINKLHVQDAVSIFSSALLQYKEEKNE